MKLSIKILGGILLLAVAASGAKADDNRVPAVKIKVGAIIEADYRFIYEPFHTVKVEPQWHYEVYQPADGEFAEGYRLKEKILVSQKGKAKLRLVDLINGKATENSTRLEAGSDVRRPEYYYSNWYLQKDTLDIAFTVGKEVRVHDKTVNDDTAYFGAYHTGTRTITIRKEDFAKALQPSQGDSFSGLADEALTFLEKQLGLDEDAIESAHDHFGGSAVGIEVKDDVVITIRDDGSLAFSPVRLKIKVAAEWVEIARD